MNDKYFTVFSVEEDKTIEELTSIDGFVAKPKPSYFKGKFKDLYNHMDVRLIQDMPIGYAKDGKPIVALVDEEGEINGKWTRMIKLNIDNEVRKQLNMHTKLEDRFYLLKGNIAFAKFDNKTHDLVGWEEENEMKDDIRRFVNFSKLIEVSNN